MFGNQYPLVVKESGLSYLLLDGSDDSKAGIVYRTDVAGSCGNKEWFIGSAPWQDNDGDLRFTWHSPCVSTAHVLRLTQGGSAIFGGALTVGGTTTFGNGNDAGYITAAVPNAFNSGYGQNNDTHATWINFYGYQGSDQKYRDLKIGDGRTGTVALFDGSSKATTFSGSVGIGRSPDINFHLHSATNECWQYITTDVANKDVGIYMGLDYDGTAN